MRPDEPERETGLWMKDNSVKILGCQKYFLIWLISSILILMHRRSPQIYIDFINAIVLE